MKTKKKLFIFGGGGHGRVLLDILQRNAEFQIVGFIDDNPKMKGVDIDGVKVLGGKSILNELRRKKINTVISGIGDNQKRCEIAAYLQEQGFGLANAIDPSATIAPSCKIGKGVTVWAGSVINTRSSIGDNVIINCGAVIEHENDIGEGAHIGPGVKLAGRVKVGKRAFVGMGANIIQNVKIGNNSIIGAGAVVLRDIPDNVMAAGVPAKIIKKI